MQNRVVVIGGSAGSLQALLQIIASLNSGLNASLFIVLHGSGKMITSLLKNRLPNPENWNIHFAQNNAIIQPSHVYVAPSGQHLLIKKNRIVTTKGPKVNRSRPAIDLLFRSAAVAYDAEVIGILLSGGLYDGVAGLQAVKRCGGMAIVQAPFDASHPDLPNNAIEAVDVDYNKPASEIGSLLNQLVVSPVNPQKDIPEEIVLENKIDLTNQHDISLIDQLGTEVSLSCPECGGPLWEVTDKNFIRYRCHTGHSLNIDSLLEGQNAEIERTLRVALRTMEEKLRVYENITQSVSRFGILAERSKGDAEEMKSHIKRLQELILKILPDEE